MRQGGGEESSGELVTGTRPFDGVRVRQLGLSRSRRLPICVYVVLSATLSGPALSLAHLHPSRIICTCHVAVRHRPSPKLNIIITG